MSKLSATPFSEGFTLALEITGKIFKSRDAQEIEKICRELFRLWERPIARCDEVLICLSPGNGEYILKWTGNLDDVYEWDRYKGHNNAKYAFGSPDIGIPLELYMENPPEFTYRDLLYICQTLKRVCLEDHGKVCRLITNFEPGPEFCESSFRYIEHPEILNWQGGAHGTSIAYDGVLHGDSFHYAAYPEGIPEGEPFAVFLGKQVKNLFEVFGFEGISFSNGLGFGTFPWSLNGRNFNGREFGLVDFAEESEAMCSFWEQFLKECPVPIMTQGTNWPVAADLATKCIPLQKYYDHRYLGAPLGNTVSVFFNDSVGFSMQALLSRISYADGFRIGFYLNDMWYPQNPFEDYPYDGEAYDLYLPSSVFLVNSEGKQGPINCMGLSGANNEKGELTSDTVIRFLPHYERALDHLPDRIGPLTLLYPFEEFHRAAEDPKQKYMPMLYFTDCYTATAIDSGLSLNSVCATDHFPAALKQGTLKDTVLYTPMPLEGASYCERLADYIQKGGKVIFVGSEKHADSRIKTLLGLSSEQPISGEMVMEAAPLLETVADEPLSGGVLLHTPVDSDGGVSAVAGDCEVLASVCQNGVKRAYMIRKNIGAGTAVWVRGSLPFSIPDGENIRYQSSEYLSAPRFARYAFSLLGWKNIQRFSEKSTPAQLMMWRQDNALYFTGYAPDNTLDLGLETPEGAPLLTGYTCELRNGLAWYHIPTTPWKPCFMFLRQETGRIRCRHVYNSAKFKNDSYSVTGLKDAELTIHVPERFWNSVEMNVSGEGFSVLAPSAETETGYRVTMDAATCTIRLTGVTGALQISW